jgi:hypothetical protein
MSDYTACVSCGEAASTKGVSLPVDTNGEIVGASYKGEWGGVPACDACDAIAMSFTIPSDPLAEAAIVRAVLDAHNAATRALRRKLMKARADLALVRRLVDETLDDVGTEPSEPELPLAPIIYLPELLPPSMFVQGARVSVDGVVYRRSLDVWRKERPHP